MAIRVPEVVLNNGRNMPLIGLGTGGESCDATKAAVLEAIKIGYRHFDTAFIYGNEKGVGKAVVEALRLGLVKSRNELFITSKLWCTCAHRDLVVPSIKKSLQNLEMEYLDLYLVHFPLKVSPNAPNSPPYLDEHIHPIDVKSVWDGMEECQRLGLAKSIGVSNFSIRWLQQTIQFATIPPVVNQVEVNPMWQQKEMIEFCKQKGIHVTAYSPLRSNNTWWGDDRIFSSDILQEIAQARGKTIAQIVLRWVHEQGVSLIVKSYNNQRMGENMQIFEWSLTKDDMKKISILPQDKSFKLFRNLGPHKLLLEIDEAW